MAREIHDLHEWSTKKIFDGESFDDIFAIDGIPLTWFYRRFFVKHNLPLWINTFEEFHKKKKLTIQRKVALTASSYALRKYCAWNEQRKIRKAHQKKGYSADPKVLFVTYFRHYGPDGTIWRIQPIVDIMQKSESLTPFPLFVSLLDEMKIKNYPGLTAIYDYYDEEIAGSSLMKAAYLHKQWKIFEKKKLNNVGMNQTNKDLWIYFSEAFRFFMSEEFLRIILLSYELSKKIIEKENIKVIAITGQNGIVDRCMMAAAQTLHLPVLLIEHGYGIRNLNEHDILDNVFIAVYGEQIRDDLIRNGIDKNRIFVTGSIESDAIMAQKRKKKNKSKEYTKEVLITTQALLEDSRIKKGAYFKRLAHIVEEILTIQSVRITIKLHPREKYLKQYEKRIQRIQPTRISVVQDNADQFLYDLLNACDVVVSLHATSTIIKASLLDKPSVTIPILDDHQDPYGEFNPSITIALKQNIKKTIESVLENPAINKDVREKMIQRFFSKNDGKARERIAKVITNLSKVT